MVEHCRKYTVGMASGMAVVLDIVLGPAEIAPVSCQPLQTAWSSLLGVRSSMCGAVAFCGPCRSGSCIFTCTSGGRGIWRSRTPWTGC